MFLYTIVLFWPLVFEWIYNTINKRYGSKPKISNFYIIMALLPMFILIAFRNSSLGADTGTYLKIFKEISETTIPEYLEKSRLEPGFVLSAKGLSYITQDLLAFQVTNNFIVFLGIFIFTKSIKKEDIPLFLYFICTLGIFFFMFTGLRQCIAMSMCLIAFVFCKKRKLLWFLVFVILGGQFHKSAYIFLIVYFIANKKITFPYICCYLVVLLVVFLNLQFFQDFLNDALEYEYKIEETSSGFIFLLVMLLLSAFSIFMIVNEYSYDEYSKQLINVNFITLLFWILRLQTRVAERPAYYFMFMSCALFAHALSLIKDNSQRLFFKLGVIVFSLLLFVYRLNTNFISLIPYSFY